MKKIAALVLAVMMLLVAAVSALGEEASKCLYMHVEKGADPRYPDGLADNTHTRRAGAEMNARIAAEYLQTLL